MTFVKGMQEIKMGLFAEKQPIVPPSMAFVYVNAKGELIPLASGQRLSRMEVKADKLTKYYEVDLTPKHFDYDGEYNSEEPTETFSIKYTVQVKAEDAALVIRTGDQNYYQLIKKAISYEIDKIAKKYTIEQYQGLQNDVERLRNDVTVSTTLEGYGIRLLDIRPTVDLSAKSKAHLEKLKQIQKQAELKRAEIKTNTDIKIEESNAKNQVQNIELGNEQQILETYGIKGYLIINAPTIEEKIKVIREIEAEKQREAQQRSDMIDKMLAEGRTLQEVKEILLLKESFQPSSAGGVLSAPTAATPNVAIAQPEQKTDPLLEMLAKEVHKGE